jgi:hypothetical protein
MMPITNSNGQAGTNHAKAKNRTKTATRFMSVQGGRLLFLSGIPPQGQIRLHLRDLLSRKLKEIHLTVNQAGVLWRSLWARSVKK